MSRTNGRKKFLNFFELSIGNGVNIHIVREKKILRTPHAKAESEQILGRPGI